MNKARKRAIPLQADISRKGNNLVSFDVHVADTFFKRLRGLLGQKSAEAGGLWIKPCNGIHTCAMGFVIDVAFLNKEGIVIEVRESVSPWRFAYNRGAQSVIEFSEGTIRRFGVTVGDTVMLRKNTVLEGT